MPDANAAKDNGPIVVQPLQHGRVGDQPRRGVAVEVHQAEVGQQVFGRGKKIEDRFMVFAEHARPECRRGQRHIVGTQHRTDPLASRQLIGKLGHVNPGRAQPSLPLYRGLVAVHFHRDGGASRAQAQTKRGERVLQTVLLSPVRANGIGHRKAVRRLREQSFEVDDVAEVPGPLARGVRASLSP
jgi:hypothetical protein